MAGWSLPSSRQGSRREAELLAQIVLAGLPIPEREVCLIPGRRFRTDFFFPEARLAVEVDGGVWTGGRHTTGQGFTQDCEKTNELTLLGYRVLRVTPEHIRSGKALAWIERGLHLFDSGGPHV